ncbi:MAG: glycosyltransferase family 4 protein [Opitutus sp.]
MKIALVCDWFNPRIGGIERHLDQLSGQLAAAGNDVTVITPTKGHSTAASGVRVQRLSASLMPGVGLIWTPSSFQRLGRAIRGGRFDIVHVHSSIISPTAFAAVYFAQKAGRPTVITGHSILGRFGPAFQALDRLCRWSTWPVAFSGVSHRVATELHSLIAPQQVDVLPNAIDPIEWRLELRPPADVVNIACVMRLAPRKRGAALLQALASVRPTFPAGLRVCLQFAGDGSERKKLEHLSRQLGLGDSVRFLGSQSPEQVKSLLARSHFFALPSKLEAFGIAALEARAAGLPVLAMTEGGVKEFVANGVEGLLARDDLEFAQHLKRLCTEASLRRAIAEYNRRTPVVFTWQHTLAAHFVTYERARRLSLLPGINRSSDVSQGDERSRPALEAAQ